MKHIVPLGNNRFIHLDSYGVSHETRRQGIVVALLASLIAAITIGALVGVDITNPSQQQIHGQSGY